MKLEIKLDPQDIKEIAQRLADIVSNSFMEKIEARIKAQNSCKRQPAEKVWKMPEGQRQAKHYWGGWSTIQFCLTGGPASILFKSGTDVNANQI